MDDSACVLLLLLLLPLPLLLPPFLLLQLLLDTFKAREVPMHLKSFASCKLLLCGRRAVATLLSRSPRGRERPRPCNRRATVNVRGLTNCAPLPRLCDLFVGREGCEKNVAACEQWKCSYVYKSNSQLNRDSAITVSKHQESTPYVQPNQERDCCEKNLINMFCKGFKTVFNVNQDMRLCIY